MWSQLFTSRVTCVPSAAYFKSNRVILGLVSVLMYSSNTYSDGMKARKEIFKSITYYNLNTKLLFIFLLFIVILIIKFNG